MDEEKGRVIMALPFLSKAFRIHAFVYS